MTRKLSLDAAGHARVTAAVATAEHGTDGEIVTIVAGRSDRYHDAALQYAVVTALLVLALIALDPALIEARIAVLDSGWNSTPDLRQVLVAAFVLEVLVFLAVRLALAWTPLSIALTPRATRTRRVRRRAIEYFRVGAERRTEARVGILLYLSLDERMAEIVADEAIHRAVPAERWGEAMAALLDEVRHGRIAEGMAAAVAGIGAVLAEQFPKTEGNRNELPDRLIEL